MRCDEPGRRSGGGRWRHARTGVARRPASRRRAIASAVSCLALVAALPAARAESGAELYAEHCTSCHAGDGRGVPGVPDMTRGKALLRSDPELFAIVGEGRGVMPGFDGLLRGKEIRRVIAHLRTLR